MRKKIKLDLLNIEVEIKEEEKDFVFNIPKIPLTAKDFKNCVVSEDKKRFLIILK